MTKQKNKPTAKELKNSRLFRKATPLVVIIIALLVFLAWSLFSVFRTYPLGDKLEYIGKESYGCYLVCDSEPGSTYYYGTDMNPDEVIEYFKGARRNTRIRTADGLTDFYLNAKDTKTFHIYIYHPTVSQKKLPDTDKHYVLAIAYFDYERAKDSLEN